MVDILSTAACYCHS